MFFQGLFLTCWNLKGGGAFQLTAISQDPEYLKGACIHMLRDCLGALDFYKDFKE